MSIATDGIAVGTVAVGAIAESLWPRLAGLLDTAERERAARFRFDRDRRQHIAAHALKRLMLSALADAVVAPQAWTFETAVGGKPQVYEGAGPHFNLSHCDGLVACAVSRRLEMGVDVERLTDEVPFEFAQSQFGQEEARWLNSLPAATRTSGFYRLWTLKEAYLKAAGFGMAQPMRDFSFGFDPLTVTFHDPSLGDASKWRFHQLEIGRRHMLALAWQSGSDKVPIDVRPMHFEDLVYGSADRAESSFWRA